MFLACLEENAVNAFGDRRESYVFLITGIFIMTNRKLHVCRLKITVGRMVSLFTGKIAAQALSMRFLTRTMVNSLADP